MRLPWSTSATTSRRPGGGEAAGERAADAAEPDDGDRAPVEVERAPDALAGHADRLLDAERGPRAGIAGAPALDGEAGDVRRALRDHRHVGVGGPDVLGGPVAPVEDARRCRRSPAARRGGRSPSQRRLAERPHDHALAAALRQVRHRGLEGHRARQAQRVGDRVARVDVAPHAAAAQRRAARGRVHGDDRVQPRATAAADEQLLVLEGLQVAVDGSEASGSLRAGPERRCGRPGRRPRRAARRARWSRAGRLGLGLDGRRVGLRGRDRRRRLRVQRRLRRPSARRARSRRRSATASPPAPSAPPRSGA